MISLINHGTADPDKFECRSLLSCRNQKMLNVVFLAATCLQLVFSASVSADSPPITLELNLDHTIDVSETLYGIFFEEINNAGEGGLYAELIQDRSFDALAAISGSDKPTSNDVDAKWQNQDIFKPSRKLSEDAGLRLTPKHELHAVNGLNQPVSWHWPDSAKVALTREQPISQHNPVAFNLTTTEAKTGITNTGFWGIPVAAGSVFQFSIYLRGSNDSKVLIQLRSQESASIYAETVLEGLSSSWQKFPAELVANGTDFKAELAVILPEPASVVLDSLSLFPKENIRKGWQNPYPFRADLLELLKDLKPRFVRFPGGCYVEGGDLLKNRFPWKTNLGLNEHRSGHANDVWGYWSTDGLGLFEYMLLAEELQAEPVYVINNGISHQESVPVSEIRPYIEETLDALEFITGDATSKWGAVRASMGRKQPWKLNYLAIGNEDCGKPYYVENYNAFYTVLKELYPELTLIANCNMGSGAPTELWDWHSYDDAKTMFNRMHDFDSLNRDVDPPIFASEYAVTTDGGWGNLKGAVAEAGFMTGMERNSDIVKLASYAPLFVHTENRGWPTNMIVFDNHRLAASPDAYPPSMIAFDNHRTYKTPSYLVQKLFSEFQGTMSVQAEILYSEGNESQEKSVAASATFQDIHSHQLAIKVSHFSSEPQNLTVAISSQRDVEYGEKATLHYIAGDDAYAENSFDYPEKVVLQKEKIRVSVKRHASKFEFQYALPAWSATVLELHERVSPSPS